MNTATPVVWTWCPKCMDRSQHVIVPGGIKCTTCHTVHKWEVHVEKKKEEV